MISGDSSSQPGRTQEYLVTLTATVTPMMGAEVQRNDPAQRRQDYKEALCFWLKIPDPRLNQILFLENSGEDLTFFKRFTEEVNVFKRDIEFISTPSDALPEGLHYGWAELKMLDEGLARSRLIKRASHIIKATGRLTFPRISVLLDRTPSDCEAMLECRIPTRAYRKGLNLVPALLNRQDAYTSTQLAIFSVRFYQQYLLDLYKTMTPYARPFTIENLIYERLKTLEESEHVFMRFPVNCDPSGVGAARGANYDGLGKKIARCLRGALRGTGLWI